jgi:hypothetical protein
METAQAIYTPPRLFDKKVRAYKNKLKRHKDAVL